MGSKSVVLANEPRAYRETIAVALGMLCPDMTVVIVEPGNLDDYVKEHNPQVVLCSTLTSLVEHQVPTWAVLYADGSGETLVQIDGKRITMPAIQLNGIVSLIQDENQHLPI